MPITTDSRLMPNHLPGGGVAAFARAEMLPTPSGGVVLVTVDADDALTVWLSSAQGYTRWVQVPFQLADGRRPRVAALDVVTSGDGSSYDVLVVADQELYACHRIPASTDPQTWVDVFAAADPLDLAPSPAGASWSRLEPGDLGSRALALWGTGAEGAGLWWLGFAPDGAPLPLQALPVPQHVTSPDDLQVVGATQLDDGTVIEGCFVVSPHRPPSAAG